MNLTKGQKEKIIDLVNSGGKIEAVKYLTDNFGITLKQAKIIVDEIDKNRGPLSKSERDVLIRKSTAGAKKPSKIIFLVFLTIGLIFAGLAAYFTVNTIEKQDNWMIVSGEVIELRGGGDGYAPVISYLWDDMEYVYYSDIYSSPPSYQTGEVVQVYVNPDFPQDVLINTFSEKWLLALIFGVMGFMFILIPTIVWRAISSY